MRHDYEYAVDHCVRSGAPHWGAGRDGNRHGTGLGRAVVSREYDQSAGAVWSWRHDGPRIGRDDGVWGHGHGHDGEWRDDGQIWRWPEPAEPRQRDPSNWNRSRDRKLRVPAGKSARQSRYDCYMDESGYRT